MAADDAKAVETEEKPKKKKLLFVIIGVLLVVIGGGGFFAYTKFFAPAPAVTEDGEAAQEQKKEPAETEALMFELEPFVVNLADPKAKRFLKIKITLELDGPAPDAKEGEPPAAQAKAEKLVPKMRDMVIMMLTSLSFEEVMTPEGKIRIRDELLERFNLVLRPERVRNIYFTDFVIQ